MDDAPLKEGRHGSDTFPLAVYHGKPGLKRSALYSHWHDEAEFFILSQGRLRFFLDGRSFILNADEAVFIRPGEVHAAFSEEACPCGFTAIVFSLDLLDCAHLGQSGSLFWEPFLRGEAELRERVLRLGALPARTLSTGLTRIIEAVDGKAPGHELAAVAGLYDVFASLIRGGSLAPVRGKPVQAGTSRAETVKTALRFMRENFSRDIEVADIAASVNMSQYHFSRFFRKMTGASPIEYLLKYRIARAEQLLSGTDRKIQDVCRSVGFRTTSHFIKIFKRFRQCTPAAYRRASNSSAGAGLRLDDPGGDAQSLAPPSNPR